MSKKVLILKSTGATLFQQPDDKRPSALELGRTLFGGRGTGKLNRLAAAAGLAGKTAALGGTVVGTAHEMQGGNLFSPLSAGYKYDATDPSGKFLAGRVEAGKQGAEKFQSQQNQISQSTPTQRMSGYTTGSNPNQVQIAQSTLAERMGGHTTGSSVGVTPPIQAMPQPPNVAQISPPAVPQPAVPQPALQPPPVTQPALSPPNMAESYTGQQKPSGPVVTPHQPATINDGTLIDTASGLNNRINSSTNVGSNAQGMLNAQVTSTEPSGVQTKLTQINPQAIAAQQAQPSPMTLAMEKLRLNSEMSPSYQQQASTANPLRTDINYANNILDSQGRKNIYGIDDTDWGQRQDQSLGNDPNVDWEQWEKNQPEYMKLAMLKSYIKKLYDEFGGYMYKMTPHEAGQFAVYTLFTLRK